MTSTTGAVDVRIYTEDAFYEALSGPRFSIENAREHIQAQYLHGYLTDIAVKAFVVECDYVDGDYLADFASYYVSCFEPYERFCRRLHFFSSKFDALHARRIMLGIAESSEIEAFKKAYLGFIVVRPLPVAVIGRTVLVPYPEDQGRRNYTSIVPYTVNLHGIALTVGSLAYQEQDTVLAACATVAIWCALHRTAYLYGSRSPRPPIITAEATKSVLYQRALPSTGLRLEQMMAAIRAAEMEPEVYEPVANNSLRLLSSLIYAYSRSGLPVILVADIIGLGKHAVTIAGFSKQKARVFQKELPRAFYATDIEGKRLKDATGNEIENPVNDNLPLMGLWINEFYAHDDGAGPFSRLVVRQPDPTLAYEFADVNWRTRFEGNWKDSTTGLLRAMVPTAIIVPVYHKIRLSHDVVLGWINRVHGLFQGSGLQTNNDRIVWDVFITETRDYKSDVVSMNLHEDRKAGLLLSSQPRFIWRAMFKIDDQPMAELLLDATSFAKAFPIFAVNWFDSAFAARAEAVMKTGLLNRQLTQSFADLLMKEVEQRESSTVGLPQSEPTSTGSAVQPAAQVTGPTMPAPAPVPGPPPHESP